MKILNGAELRDFIKERQAKQVRALRQSWHITPKLIIFYDSDSKVVETYTRLKRIYGEDILVEVEVRRATAENLADLINQANYNESIHGIVVQLPFGNETDSQVVKEALTKINPNKDVDGLSGTGPYSSATATAINWLLTGYNIDLSGRKIAIVGQGLLVGVPLAKMWRKSGFDVTTFDISTEDQLEKTLNQYDVVITATGVPGLIKDHMIKQGAVVVDAGTATEGGVIKGDLDENIRLFRPDLTITPTKGGVGPLTIAVLIDNVIVSARKIADQQGQKDQK